MKMKTLCVLLTICSLSQCADKINKDLCGAWAIKGDYIAWKNGSKEKDIFPTRIGNNEYLVLTDSIIIDCDDNKSSFSVPGGLWRIKSLSKLDETKYELRLKSYDNQEKNGTLYINKIDDSTIYFSSGNMSIEFENEFNQSMLDLGERWQYVLCDVVGKDR
jgi:hypothetical protein